MNLVRRLWDSCTGASRETGNWRVKVAVRSRNHCRVRVRTDSAYDTAVSGSRVKARIKMLAPRSFGHPNVFSSNRGCLRTAPRLAAAPSNSQERVSTGVRRICHADPLILSPMVPAACSSAARAREQPCKFSTNAGELLPVAFPVGITLASGDVGKTITGKFVPAQLRLSGEEERRFQAMKNLQRPMKVCPECGGLDTQPSRLRWFDRFLTVLLVRPHRCRRCGIRFWRFP